MGTMLVDLVRFELTTSSMPWKRAPNCATGPLEERFQYIMRFRYHGRGWTREQAWELLCEFTKSDSLRQHALAVEACVAAYARKFGEDEAKWSVTALLHDFDWEIHPAAARSSDERRADPGRARRGCGDPPRDPVACQFHAACRASRTLEKTLFACDELAGFLTACSYVKPNRSIHEVDVKSVRKKLKDKAFARSVNRDDILNGAAELGVDWTSTSRSASRPCSSARRSWVWPERNQRRPRAFSIATM